MLKRKKLFIGGDIYKAGNIGDDAILLGIIKILEKLNQDFFYFVTTLKGRNIDLPITKKRWRCVASNDFYEIIHAIHNSDCVIGGGGTLIGDELGLNFPLKYVAKIITIAKFFGKPVYFFSIGANELQNKKSGDIVKKIFSLSDRFVLRDKGSLRVCQNYFSAGKLKLSADPAFVLKARKIKRINSLKKRFNKKGHFGVNVVNESWQARTDYKKVIATFCGYVYKKYKLKPVFFCNEVRRGKFYDYEASKKVISFMSSNLKRKSILLKPVYYSPEEMIDLISSFQFILGMRMHALIFASLTGTPFITISRIDKVDNFMSQFGLKSSCSIKNPSLSSLKRDTDKILQHNKKFTSKIEDKLEEYKKRAEKNLSFIRPFIKKQKLNFKKSKKTNLASLKMLPKKDLIKFYIKNL